MGATNGYASDDLDDYDDDFEGEEEEMSPEDKAAMAKATVEVQKTLGADGKKITSKQIQEALWHYYYDVEKSVGYLKKTYLATQSKPAPKKAPEGMSEAIFFSSDQDLFADALGVDASFVNTCSGLDDEYELQRAGSGSFTPITTSVSPARIFDFSDMPWFDVPEHRKTVFIAPPRPRGGLLGGGDGSKMSKLQALAAARKKKTEEKKDQDQAVKGIRRLSISENPETVKKENMAPAAFPKRQKLSDPREQVGSSPPPLRDLNAKPQFSSSIKRETELLAGYEANDAPEDMEIEGTAATPHSAPSVFAQTLFGPAPGASRKRQSDLLSMPYTTSSSFSAAAFDEPSPDDVVLAAQAKGSNFA